MKEMYVLHTPLPLAATSWYGTRLAGVGALVTTIVMPSEGHDVHPFKRALCRIGTRLSKRVCEKVLQERRR